MAQQESTSQDLADLLATRNFNTEYKNAQGQDAPPNDATTFSFDYKSSAGNNYGTVVILFSDEGEIMLFSNDKLGKTMDSPEDKKEWFGFVQQLSEFATRHNFNNFTPLNINQLKHTMAGMAAIKEGLFEGYYGTRKTSYMGEQTAARLVIKHNRMLGENDKRYRYVESLFIETADGEKFKLPFTKLSGGRAMLEHVKNGGKTYDIRGSHICELVEEMNVLARFNRASQQRMFEGLTQDLVETAHNYYYALKENLQHISTGRGYKEYFESWTPADIGDEDALVEDLKQMFVEQTLDARIEAALPTLAKIQQQGAKMKEAEIFENWVNNVMEGTWALPDTPEAQQKLTELMGKELIVGPDATNATEQLYDVIGDDQLFDILGDLAQRDPRANIWDDTDVQARLAELGIQTPQSTEAEPNNVAQDTAPRQQGMAENTELATMLKYAGVPVNESRIHENSEYTHEIIAKTLAREKPGMETLRTSKDFYSAVYHELIAIGMTPRSARNLISYDEDFIGDVATSYNHYQSNPALDESNSGMIMPEGDPIATVEAMPDLSAPVVEGSCNSTMEGEYCPEHGLAECGMYEMGTVAGGMAPVVGEGTERDKHYYLRNDIWRVMDGDEVVDEYKPARYEVVGAKKLLAQYDDDNIDVTHVISPMGVVTYLYGKPEDDMDEGINDPINSNSAITGAYYESKEDNALLARIKSLALLK